MRFTAKRTKRRAPYHCIRHDGAGRYWLFVLGIARMAMTHCKKKLYIENGSLQDSKLKAFFYTKYKLLTFIIDGLALLTWVCWEADWEQLLAITATLYIWSNPHECLTHWNSARIYRWVHWPGTTTRHSDRRHSWLDAHHRLAKRLPRNFSGKTQQCNFGLRYWLVPLLNCALLPN